MRTDTVAKVVVGLCVSWVWSASAGPAAGAAALGKRYVNGVYGFSFRTPAGAHRKRDLTKSRLMTWTGRDEMTGAIAWTLTVSHVREAKLTKVDLKTYKDVLAAKLKKDENFQIDVAKVIPMAGKGAIDLRGTSGGELRLWQRQVWVEIRTKEFLVFRISGPVTLKREVDALVGAVAGSLQVLDPTAARKQRAANLRRGESLLEGITPAAMAAALYPRAQWFLLKMKAKHVGFVKIEEKARAFQGVDGYAVTTWLMVQFPKTPVRLMRREMFATPDGQLERWREQWQSGSGKRAQNGAEDGLKKGEVIVCHIDTGGKIHTLKPKKAPRGTYRPGTKVRRRIYLPRAIGMLLPRLVDRAKPASYAFATYTSAANDFDMRTFTVVGPEKLTTLGGAIDAVRIQDRPAEDEEPATVWVNSRGELLRLHSADGLVMDVASEAGVLRRFPKAKLIVLALDGKKPPKKPKKPKAPTGLRTLTPARP